MRTTLSACLAALVAAVLATTSAQAQNAKSFVASTGNDANACATEALPCRTMNGALGKTNAGGAIYCLDNGEFSGATSTTITKSITIDCAGTGGSLSPGAGTINAISIAGAATDIIHIRGLKVFTSSGRPLLFGNTAAAASVRVEGCDLVGTGGFTAVLLGNSAGSTNVLDLFFVNTTIGNGFNGINLTPNGGAIKLTLDNVRIFKSVENGIMLNGTSATTSPGVRVTMKNSTITGNGENGFRASSSGGTTRVFVEDSVIAQNGLTGISVSGANADFIVSRSTITQNNTGLSAVAGGRLFSYGNNGIHGNLNGNGAFTGLIPLQ